MRTKKNLWIVLVLFIICHSFPGKAQVLKIENGIAFSHLHLPNVVTELYDLGVYPYQMSIGLDYLDRGWFALSSSVGYLRKGGGIENLYIAGDGFVQAGDFYNKQDYLTANSTFRVKKTFAVADRFTLYAGVGPRVDFLLAEHIDCSPSYKEELKDMVFDGNEVIAGLKCEAGFDYAFGRYQIGLNAAWLPSFTNVVGDLRDRTFTLGFVLGYRLGKE